MPFVVAGSNTVKLQQLQILSYGLSYFCNVNPPNFIALLQEEMDLYLDLSMTMSSVFHPQFESSCVRWANLGSI